MPLTLSSDFESFVLENRPLLDVRAPIEFEKGAFVTATNIAIMNDKERHLVGCRYKESGNESAIQLAQELIKEKGKLERVQAWKNYLAKNPNALLYCFRGGQRSKIAQEWLHEAGIDITRIKGGYKAFRNYLLQRSLEIIKETPIVILGGRTGSGKTILLNELANNIDLEALANHRGSSFGNFANKQPSQIDFENALAYKLIQHNGQNHKYLIIEHESHNIGKNYIPKEVYHHLMQGKLFILETPLQERVDIIYEEYVTQAIVKYERFYGADGVYQWEEYVKKSLLKIEKRLGSQRYKELSALFQKAFLLHGTTVATEFYKEWIAQLLSTYYDPMYDYQLEKTQIPITFRGSKNEILDNLLIYS